jgi:hypothetical protein
MTSHIDNVVERPADLTAAWLISAICAGTIADFIAVSNPAPRRRAACG